MVCIVILGGVHFFRVGVHFGFVGCIFKGGVQITGQSFIRQEKDNHKKENGSPFGTAAFVLCVYITESLCYLLPNRWAKK